MGKLLIIAGIILIVLGLVIHYTGSLPIGKLPGDIVIERKNFKFYFPIASSILLSILFSLLLYIFYRLRG